MVIDQTLETLPDEIVGHFGQEQHTHDTPDVPVSLAGRDYRLSHRRLTDAGGREVGDIIALRDVTIGSDSVVTAITQTSLITGALGVAIIVFFHFFLGHMAKVLDSRTAALAESESATRKAQQLLQTTIDAMPDAVLAMTPDYRIVMANAAARGVGDHDDPVAERLTCHKVFRRSDGPCDLEANPCPMREVLRTKAAITVEHAHLSEGGEVCMELTAAPVLDEHGNVSHVVQACRDITERKRASEALTKEIGERERVAEELRERMEELERFNRLAVGREERVIELKREVNEMARKAGADPPYNSALVVGERGEPDVRHT